MNTKTMPELIFASDGLRTILNEPWECPGCFTMHYFFISTPEGYRCPGCADQGSLPKVRSIVREISKTLGIVTVL